MRSDRRSQEDRIRTAAATLAPSFEVEFYQNAVHLKTRDIRFRIRDSRTGNIVVAIPADFEWATTEVEDMSDLQLRTKIATLIGQRL
jgi:hypothetical protein